MKATDNTFTFDGRTYKRKQGHVHGDIIEFTYGPKTVKGELISFTEQSIVVKKEFAAMGGLYRIADIRPIQPRTAPKTD